MWTIREGTRERGRGKGIRSEQLRIDWRQLIQFKRTFIEPVPQRREEGFLEAGIEAFHSGTHFVGRRGRNVHLAAMVATPRKSVGAQVLLLHSPVGRSWSRPVYRFNEHYGQLNCLPQRAGECALPRFLCRVDSRPSREPIIRKQWPFRKRNRRDFRDFVVFDWSRYLVARNQQLASCFDRELEITICAVQLGPA